jgi:hypothetical protein
MLASENCDEEDKCQTKEGTKDMYEFIRYQLIVVDGQSRTIELSTISTFEGPTSHTEECLA